MKIFTGNANPQLANKVSEELGVELSKATVERFSDGEISVQLEDNVRGQDCFVIQPTCAPVNNNLMELLIILDAMKRASPRRITAVIPYYGYARQDKLVKARAPIAARLVADLIESAGADRVMAMDLHAAQIQGFFKIPVDNLYSRPVLVEEIKSRFNPESITIVSPDAGGAERARAYAKRFDAPLAIIDKRRERANQSEVMHVIGDVKDRNCVIVDDMIDTAGTLCNGVAALREHGASNILAAITHPVLSGPAYKNLHRSHLTELITTDTIPLEPGTYYQPKVTVASIAPLLAEAIRRTHNEESISSLFK